MCKHGRIGVFISLSLCTNSHITKILGILDVFRETHRNMTQYWLVFPNFPIAFSRRRKECHANRVELMFSLVHPFVQTVTLQKSWESWMFFEKPIEI